LADGKRESRYREGELVVAANVEGLREEAAHNDWVRLWSEGNEVIGVWWLTIGEKCWRVFFLSSSWLAWVIFMWLVSMGNSGEGDGHWLTGGWLEWFSEGGWLGFESCSRVVAVGRCCCYDGHSWRKLFGREKKGWGHEAMKLVGVVVTGNKEDKETIVRLLWRKWWRDGQQWCEVTIDERKRGYRCYGG
jgi:hypothetical protein